MFLENRLSTFLNKRKWIIPALFIHMCVLLVAAIVFIEIRRLNETPVEFAFSIGGELCAMAIAIMITTSILPAHKRQSGYIRIFVTLLTIGCSVLFFDTAQMLVDGIPELIQLNKVLCICVFISSAFFYYFFFLYASLALKCEGKMMDIISVVGAFLLFITSLLPFINYFYPLYFTIDEATGIYARNTDTWWISQIFSCYAVLSTFVAIFFSKESISTKLVITAFAALPVIALGAGGYKYGVSVQFTAMMASLVLIYAFIFSKNERVLYSTNKELGVASTIQQQTLPANFPAFPDRKDFDIYASMTPAKEVGGDFYDFFLIDDSHLGLVIADVSDKGIPAALFMMASRIMARNYALLKLSPKDVLTAVNRQICDESGADMFVTIWFGVLDLKTGLLTATNAGHEKPVIKQPDGHFQIIKDKHNFVVGWDKNTKYSEYQIQLQKGARIFVYTDGVPESSNGTERFGTDRMLQTLNENENSSPEIIIKEMSNAISKFVGKQDQFDDTTMLCVEYKGNDMDKSESYKVKAVVESLESALDPVIEALEAFGADHKTCYKVRLALDEILTNVVSYAYDDDNGEIEIRYEISEETRTVTISIIDEGKPFNPLEMKDPDLDADPSERKIGGLGIFIVRQTMDDVSYKRENNRNVLIIKKII